MFVFILFEGSDESGILAVRKTLESAQQAGQEQIAPEVRDKNPHIYPVRWYESAIYSGQWEAHGWALFIEQHEVKD